MSDTIKAHRIFLVDDHPALRHGIALMLRLEQHEICGEADDPAVALDQIIASQADLAIVDLSLGDLHAFDLIAMLAQQGVRVLVYSMHEDPLSIRRSLRSGADGYLTKREDGNLLLEAVRKLLSGERFLSPAASRALLSRNASVLEANVETQLSEREIQIMGLLAQGQSNATIAAMLSISARTVETYCERIIKKYQLPGMKELRQLAIMKGSPKPDGTSPMAG